MAAAINLQPNASTLGVGILGDAAGKERRNAAPVRPLRRFSLC
jgi:hypothetical protein